MTPLTPSLAQQIKDACSEYIAAQKACIKASDARFALPPGSTRARTTTAAARWSRCAEDRNRKEDVLLALVKSLVS